MEEEEERERRRRKEEKEKERRIGEMAVDTNTWNIRMKT